MFPKIIKPAREFLLWWTRATPRQKLVFIKTFTIFVDWNIVQRDGSVEAKQWMPYSQIIGFSYKYSAGEENEFLCDT